MTGAAADMPAGARGVDPAASNDIEWATLPRRRSGSYGNAT
jgi:hypothetical protein